MKTCPKCHEAVKQRKKEACPGCGTPLFLSKGQWRRTSDKVLADDLRKIFKPVVEKNLKASGFMLLPQEWVFAYMAIDTLRNWYNDLNKKPGEFNTVVLLVAHSFLADNYWKENVKSIRNFTFNCVKEAMKVQKQIQEEQRKLEIQERRVNNANTNKANLSVQYD